ncbi:coiled-coil domain-containing protein 97 [Sphaerodactylus townsendi]|uniref:coiled-coil domain-containing protein 97 n=1 Tax=Sphaerodactylus townsendi TaxID=933632 RepID=UPI0020270C5B|nr:coiled-coil domain-containing protein 97 [Sphaerodactylus townsendi]
MFLSAGDRKWSTGDRKCAPELSRGWLAFSWGQDFRLGMEAGGDSLREPDSSAVSSLENMEQRKPDDPTATETPENCFSNETEPARPLCLTQETVEISKTAKGTLSSQACREAEQMRDVLGSYVCHGDSSARVRQPLWGEQMSGVPVLQSGLSDTNGIFKTSHPREAQLWNAGSNFLPGKYGSARMFSPFSVRVELKTRIPATDQTNGAAKPTHPDSGKIETADAAADLPEEQTEDADIRLPAFCSRKPESPPQPTEDEDPALLAMFHTVASSRLAVRSQQKDEPDFTPVQKLAILQELYHTKPLVFLERFRTALREDHLPCFRHLSGNYEADFYCAEVRRAGLGKTRHTRVRNKRYAALQQLIQGGEYFSDEQMRSRDPLLYEQYIGQYLSDQELQELGSCKQEAACSLSGVLLDSYQEDILQQRLQVQQEQEEACLEKEEETDSDSSDDEAMVSSPKDHWVPDPEEKAFLREEFTSRMYQRFLDGKDRDFDYSEVDENPDFDNLDIVSRDEEERYFDGEEPEEADSMEAE